MNGIYSKDYLGSKYKVLTDYTFFIPSDFDINKIDAEVLNILTQHSNLVQEILEDFGNFNRLTFSEFLDTINLLKLYLLAQNQETYKEYLKSDGGIKVNIDLGNKCSFECSHCSIVGNQNGTDLNVLEIEEYFKNFNDFENVINEITFLNGGEFLERDNFDEILNFFLKKGINKFSFISRGIKEENEKKYEKKTDLIEKKLKKLKFEFPNFKLEIGISIDKFSKIQEEFIVYNTLFLFNLNRIFSNNVIFISSGNNIYNYEETDVLINTILSIISDEHDLGGFEFKKQVNDGDMFYLESINKFGDSKIKFFIKNTFINMDGRGEKNYKQVENKIPEDNRPLDIFTTQDRSNKKIENIGGFSCQPLMLPKNLTIKKGGDIKVCISTYLKYLDNFNYDNVKNLTQKQFIDILVKYHINLYGELGINEILELIKSKRNGDNFCLNNVYLQKEKEF